ncbi:MAG: zinc-ribbon domain-containing protein [Candidatus Korobacteraceae bacterium]
MAFCPNCGTQIADNVAFCPSCGKGTSQASGAAAAPPPAPAPAPEAGYSPQAAPVVMAAPLAENVAGMLAYFTIIPAIIFLLIEPYNRNRFVRFHAFQCLFVAAALVVIDVVLMILSSILHLVPVIGWMVTALLWPLYSLAVLALWLLLVIKAYQHQIFKLPVIGDIAEKQAGA